MEASVILSKLKDVFDEVEVFLEKSRSLEFELKNSRDFSKGLEESAGIGIRAIKGNKMAFVSMPYNSDRLDEIIKETKEAIEYSKTLEVPTIPKNASTYNKSVQFKEIDENEARGRLEFLSSTAKGFDKRIKDVKSAGIGISFEHVEIANSHGLAVEYEKASAGASLEILAEDKNSDLGYYHLDADEIDHIDLEFLAKKAANLAVNKLYPKPIQTKKYSVIISNDTFRDILAHFLGIFNGYSVLNHTTPLEGKLNERVFSDKITIIDSKQIKNRPNNTDVDEEGNERNDIVIVESGVLKTFMHNTYTSNRLNTKNTAHAKRSGFDTLPKVGPFNLHIKSNENIDRNKLLNMVDGVYITDIMGLHMANTISGDFSLGVNGFLIHNGELISYFKAATFADNLFEIMKRVIAVSNNVYFSGSVGSPDIAVADCLIGESNG